MGRRKRMALSGRVVDALPVTDRDTIYCKRQPDPIQESSLTAIF